jgi:hypothetical protein
MRNVHDESDDEIHIQESEDSGDEGTPPPTPSPPAHGLPQGDPVFNPITVTIADDSSSEDDGFLEVIQVDRYWNRNTPPACRRRDDQFPCQAIGRSCRRAVAIFALENSVLTFECPARNLAVDVPVFPGINVFSWCIANLYCKGIVPLIVTPLPSLEGIPEFFIRGLPPGLTWMRVETTYGPLRPATHSYVFPVELSLPGLLACFFSGPVPQGLLANPSPSVNLQAVWQGAKHFFVSVYSMPEDGPLLSNPNMRIVDV